MIRVTKTYNIALTETQAEELYEFLQGAKDDGLLSIDMDLVLVLNELKRHFGTDEHLKTFLR